MMKLNTDEKESSRKDIGEFIIESLIYVAIVGFIILMIYSIHKNISTNTENKEVISSAEITTMRMERDNEDIARYYMDINRDDNNRKYTIEITKGDFIEYKEGETIQVKFKSNNAYLLRN